MKPLTLLLFFGIFISCNAQEIKLPDEVPYGPNPETPPKELLDDADLLNFDSLSVIENKISPRKIIRTYYLNGQLFNGWSLQLFHDNDHRYRYTKFKNGLAVWQIGFYDNGALDADFHMKDGLNYGSQRMWLKGGGLYIDTYFLEGEIQHGKQLRWHSNGVLARDALFEKGALFFEVLFDNEGNITETKGDIPEKYK